MLQLGDIAEDAIVDFPWGSNGADGASITRATNGTISVYKGNNTTQVTAGVTDDEDYDSLTGVHHVRVDTSADAFYATGFDYFVVLSGAVIDGKTVNAPLAHFSIENRRGEAAFDRVMVALPNAATGASGGIAGVAQTDAIEADTQDIQSRVPAALVGGRIASDLGSIASSTTRAGQLATVLDNAYLDATISSRATPGQVNSECDTALADYDAPTRSEATSDKNEILTRLGTPAGVSLSADLAALNDVSPSDVQTAAAAALAAYDPPTRSEATADKNEVLTRLGTPEGASVSADVAAVALVADKLDTTLEVDGADYRFTAGALAEAPTGGGGGGAPTAAQVADAVWDELLADHTTPGSAGAQLQAAGASGDPWATLVPGSYGAGTAGKKLGDLPQDISVVVPAAVANASQTPGLIAALRGDTLRKTLPTLGDITGHTQCVFTLKKRESDPDSAAVLSIDEDGGLLWLNGAAAPDASKASLTIADEADAEPALVIDEAIMATLPVVSGGWVWDVQVWNGGDIVTPIAGQWSVSPDVTRAV